MTLPLFNIPYKECYSSTIEFKTQVNEKQKGEEQRYPVWTYPKRTFTLKFDKKMSDRILIENFFIDVMTIHNGQFTWVWDTAKGGNGNTYTCWLDLDSLNSSIKELGYSETTLKFITIDNNPVTAVNNLDFCHKAEADYNVEFNLIQDKILTSNYKMRQLWKAPRRSWTLTFENKPKVSKKLENFFISKRGKFRYFSWKWDKKFGGDNNYYYVRFDNDVLESEIKELGYSKTQIKLKEVIPNPELISEYEKDEIIPRRLLNIDILGGSINILDNETLDLLSYNNKDYIGAPLEISDIIIDDNSNIAKVEVTVSNVGQGISSIIGNRGNVVNKADATITMVLLDVNSNTIINNSQRIIWFGQCNNLKINNENAKVDIQTPLGGYEYNCPVAKYRPTCNVRRFKDCRCGYSGNETSCDRTFERCQELNNIQNFQGFISLPAETVIKI